MGRSLSRSAHIGLNASRRVRTFACGRLATVYRSHDPCFNVFLMGERVVTFVAHCTVKQIHWLHGYSRNSKRLVVMLWRRNPTSIPDVWTAALLANQENIAVNVNQLNYFFTIELFSTLCKPAQLLSIWYNFWFWASVWERNCSFSVVR